MCASAKFWMSVLVDLKKPGCARCVFLVCDGLEGLPEVVENVGPLTIVQTSLFTSLWNTFRLASRKDADAIKRDINRFTPRTPPMRHWSLWMNWREKWGKKYRGYDPVVAQCVERVSSVS
jgi:transposase-like protein